LLGTSVTALENLTAKLAELDGATPLSGDFADVFTCAQRSFNEAKCQFLALDRQVSMAWPDTRWATRFANKLEQVNGDAHAVETQWDRVTSVTRSGRSEQNRHLRDSVDELLRLLKERYPGLFTNGS
jgi:hypothetical protein